MALTTTVPALRGVSTLPLRVALPLTSIHVIGCPEAVVDGNVNVWPARSPSPGLIVITEPEPDGLRTTPATGFIAHGKVSAVPGSELPLASRIAVPAGSWIAVPSAMPFGAPSPV